MRRLARRPAGGDADAWLRRAAALGGGEGRRVDDPGALRRELMAVFDQLPAPLREAINYAPEALDPVSLATLCRRHGAANVLAMIEMKLDRARKRPPSKPPR